MQFARYLAKGLLTFESLEDEGNAVVLCPTCHRNFDDINYPGLLFLPTDLSFFIEYEKRDFDERSRIAALQGVIRLRQTPTAQEYHDHLQQRDAISEDELGGLYYRYTLRDYFPIHMDTSFVPGLGPYTLPGLWHGAPMAALSSAFSVGTVPGITSLC